MILIDEQEYLNLEPEQVNDFFKLMDERCTGHKATVIASNLEYEGLGIFLGNRPLTDALLGRLRHRCITIRIEGINLRAVTPA